PGGGLATTTPPPPRAHDHGKGRQREGVDEPGEEQGTDRLDAAKNGDGTPILFAKFPYVCDWVFSDESAVPGQFLRQSGRDNVLVHRGNPLRKGFFGFGPEL